MSKTTINRFRSLFAPGSLRIQLLFRSVLILAVLLVLIGLFQYVFMREVIYKNKADSMQSQVMSMPPGAWQQIGIYSDNSNPRPPLFFIPGAGVAFIDSNGNYSVLSNGPNGMQPPRLNQQAYLDALKKGPGLNYQVVDDGGVPEQLIVLQPVAPGPGEAFGIVEISTLTSPLKELLIRQLLTFLLLSLLAMLFGLAAFLPALKKTLVPLFNMIETAEQIDAGNLARRFPTRQGQMEIDRLAESFNGMLERLEGSFEAERQTQEQMRRFIADASHELRTPLTSIRGFLEVLLRGAVNQPDQLHKALTSMHQESERLSKLVHDLLLLAKLDRKVPVDVADGLLDSVIRDMEPQLRILAGSRKLSLQIEPNVRCKFDTDKMKQMILNLFQNAVQYTDPDTGYIQVSLFKKCDSVQLSIQDNGPGISACYLPRVFDRFYRMDSSRARKHGGAGLGLSITKSIIEAHGGAISVESQEGHGCTFHVLFPG
ncbi:MAG TPA: ATP-binding protein [Spirochaetia bacterium]|nr:ATP-binding protein [Spirochaetia bacterium]